MPGLSHPPHADVEAIRKLLREYTSESFFKELLQNANDAKATDVCIYVYDKDFGLQCSHPLLQGSGMVVINNGPFKQEHKEGIEVIGLSNRASDSGSIGRFGLGVKSLFHLCEGFFFLESNNDPELRSFLTPWHGSIPENSAAYPEWWDVEESDWDTMHSQVREFAPGSDSWDDWFAIFIPFRSATVLQAESLRKEYPGDDEGYTLKLWDNFNTGAPSLEESMIFLKGIKRISFRAGEQCREITKGDILHDSEVLNINDHRVYKKEFDEGDQHPEVGRHHGSEHWPVVTSRATLRQEKDKIRWLGGLAICSSPPSGKVPNLRVFWSVFLPVGNKPILEVPLSKFDKDIHIFVHGYFFPNSQRTEVTGALNGFENGMLEDGRADEDSVKENWNKELATHEDGVLRLLIPVLSDFLDKENVENRGIECLVQTIKQSKPFYDLYQQHICQNVSFGRLASENGWKWQSFESTSTPLFFPALEFDQPNAESLVPKLINDFNDRPVLLLGNPSLLKPGVETRVWHADDFQYFFGNLDDQALKQSEGCKYIRGLLQKFTAAAEETIDCWRELEIFPLKDLRNASQVVSYHRLQELSARGILYSSVVSELKKPLVGACPVSEQWVMEDDIGVGDIDAVLLNHEVAASIVLQQRELGSGDTRIALVEKLLPRISNEKVLGAIRYLLHAQFDQRDEVESILYFQSSNDDWNQVFQATFRHLGEGWKVLPSIFEGSFKERDKATLCIETCDADGFRSFCHETNTSEIPLQDFHDFLLKKLLDEDDNEILQDLPIHKVATNRWVTVSEKVFLESDDVGQPLFEGDVVIVGQLDELRKTATVARRSKDPVLIARQEQLFDGRILDKEGMMHLACCQPNPSKFANLIIRILGSVGNPNKVTRDKLIDTNWLQLNNGTVGSPRKLLWIEGAEDALESVAQTNPLSEGVFTKYQVEFNWKDDAYANAWKSLKYLIPKQQSDIIELLMAGWEGQSALFFGREDFDCFEELEKWLDIVSSIDQDISPAILILQALRANCKEDESERENVMAIANFFSQSWDGGEASRYDKVLTSLRQLHQSSPKDKKGGVAEVFHDYLDYANQSGRWGDCYRTEPEFSLLNLEGEWTPAGMLVLQNDMIANEAIIHPDAVKSLRLQRSESQAYNQGRGGRVRLDQSKLAETLENYGATLVQHVDGFKDKIWGIFMALLGDSDPVRRLADRLNTSISTETIRQKLGLPTHITDHEYWCEHVNESDHVELVAINGATFRAPLKSGQPMFVVPRKMIDGDTLLFSLRSLEPPLRWYFDLQAPQSLCKYSYEELRPAFLTLLKEASDSIKSSQNSIYDLDQFLKQVEDMGQLGLQMAQHEILQSFTIHATQLGIRPETDEQFKKAMKHFDDAKRLNAESDELGDDDGKIEKRSTKARRKGMRILREIFNSNSPVLDELREKMRVEIEQQQYCPGSVPFELFQNADDAYVEEEHLNNKVSYPIFVMMANVQTVRFAHWGRLINDASTVQGDKRRKYCRDLEKMLILHGSDKQGAEGEENVTGKFGLGFKSVYLISPSPYVSSGDLNFEVVGSLYPKKADCLELKKFLEKHRPDGALNPGTCIDLPLDNNVEEDFGNFKRLAPYLVVFSKKIKQIRLCGDLYQEISWKPTPTGSMVERGMGIHVGKNTEDDTLLQVESQAKGISWLFQIKGKSFSKLPEIVPVLWSTTPLRNTDALGFALNAKFDPNPGRTELGSGEHSRDHNQQLENAASHVLYNFLDWLYRNLESDTGIEGLALESKLCWQSIWDLFTALPTGLKGGSEGTRRAVNAVWGINGYRKILHERDVIPNGLKGAVEQYTNLGTIDFVVSGYLGTPKGLDILSRILAWEKRMFEQLPGTGCCNLNHGMFVSSKVWNHLSSHIPGIKPPTKDKYNLHDLLDDVLGAERRVPPEISSELGNHLGQDLFIEEDKKRGYDWPTEEKSELIGLLKKFRFKSVADDWEKSSKLLCPKIKKGNEYRRSALAPDQRLLATEYAESENGLELFQLCRGGMHVTAKEMSDWVEEAVNKIDQAKTKAAVEFFSNNDEMSADVAKELSEDCIKRLKNSKYYQNLDQAGKIKFDNTIVSGQVKKADEEGRAYDPNGNEESSEGPEPEPEPSLELDEVFTAWVEHLAVEKFTLSGRYRKLVFPHLDVDASLSEELKDTDTPYRKLAWYRFLCLGCTLSVPLGIDPYSRIEPFWGKLNEFKFWDRTAPDGEFNSSGMDSLFEDVFQQIRHLGEDADLWRRVFYDFRKMYYLVFQNDFPGLMLELAKHPEVENDQLINFLREGQLPDALRNPHQNPRIQGAVGQSMSGPLLFVMRELRRLEVIPHNIFDCACFYVNSPVRAVLFKMGWIDDRDRYRRTFENHLELSELLFDKLQKHRPEMVKYLDLPFQWYAYSRLRKR